MLLGLIFGVAKLNEWLQELKGGVGAMIAVYWLKRKGEGEVLRGLMPFICWKMCFLKARIFAFSEDKALSM